MTDRERMAAIGFMYCAAAAMLIAGLVLCGGGCVQGGPEREGEAGEGQLLEPESALPVVLKAEAATECAYPLCTALLCESLIDVETRLAVPWEVAVGEPDELVECQHSGCEGDDAQAALCHDGLWCQRPRLYACPEGWAGD